MSEVRLIDANALKEAMRKAKRRHYSAFSDVTLQGIYQVIDNAPTVSPEKALMNKLKGGAENDT